MRHRHVVTGLASAACAAACAPPAHAQESGPPPAGRFELTPYVGYRSGGGVDAEDGTVDFDDAASLGASLEYVARPGGLVGLLYSRQGTTAVVRPRAAGEQESSLDVTIHYLQLSGSSDLERAGPLTPFVTASVGGAYFDPEPPDAQGDWNVAGSVGAGLGTSLGTRLRSRLEARLLGTLLDAESNVFCVLPGGCAVSVNGEPVVQFDLSLGLSFVF